MSSATPPGTSQATPLDALRCTVDDSREIGILLYELCKRGAQLSLNLDGSPVYCASSILAMDVERAELVLDGSIDAALNARLAAGLPVNVHAQLDRVDIGFVLQAMQQASHQGRPALRAAIPRQVLHLQRRELYRLSTPLSQWPTCDLPLGIHSERGSALRVADIGSGGMALLHELPEALLYLGQRVHECRLHIPDGPCLTVDIRICNERLITRPDGDALRRTGVAFDGLPVSAQNHISRYIFSIDRQRSARRQRSD